MPKRLPNWSVMESSVYNEFAERINQALGKPVDARLHPDVRAFAVATAKQLAAIANYTQIIAAHNCHIALHAAKVQRRKLRRNNLAYDHDTTLTILEYALQSVEDRKRPTIKAAIAATEILQELRCNALLLPSPQ